jgi:Protein of unknown function (DUF3047)
VVVAAVLVLASSVSAAFAARVVVEDWTSQPLGAHGIPAGWTKYATPGGRPAYDFTIVEDEGRRALRLHSRDDHSTIAKQVDVDLVATPILEWSWKVLELPSGADVRNRATSDLTGHLFVVWPRVPAALRSRLVGYAWGTSEPAGSMLRSRKSGTVTFVILRSGAEGLGRWLTERRDVAADYQKIYGEPPDNPKAVAISVDTNDTHSAAAALIDTIAFTSR